MDVEEITAAITAGDLDGNLEPIAAAIWARHDAGAVTFAWRITFDGDTWDAESVTLGELSWVEGRLWTEGVDAGGPWRRRITRAELVPKARADHALTLVVAHLHKAQGVPLAEALKRAEAVTAADLESMVSEFEVVRPPKDGSTPPPTS